MANQHQSLLDTLTEWSKLDIANKADESSDKALSDDVARIYAITTAKRGKAQQLPSCILQPV